MRSRIEIRITPDKKKQITAMAKECGLTVTDFVIMRALSAVSKPETVVGNNNVSNVPGKPSKIHFVLN